ncbi:MAG: head GIN domain-containing protein [Pirellulales bacterium]
MSIRTAALAILTVTVPMFVGCRTWEPPIPGSGTIKQETRTVTAFDSITVAGSGILIIESGATGPECTVECDDNLLEYIETEVKDGTLVVHHTKNIGPTQELALKIKSDHVKKVTLAGSWRTTISGVDEAAFELDVAGSGDVIASGKSVDLTVGTAGSGKLDLLELQAEKVELNIAGSGSAMVHAGQKLKVDIAGSGNVQYTGEPQVEKNIAGFGSVKRIAGSAKSTEGDNAPATTPSPTPDSQ